MRCFLGGDESWRAEVHWEVRSGSAGPVFVDFGEERGNQPQERWRFGEDARDTGSALEFLVDALGRIGGAQALAVFLGQAEDGEAFGHVELEPGGEFGRGLGVFGDHGLEEGFGEGAVLGMEDFAQFAGDDLAQGELGDVLGGILLEMELAALPGHPREAAHEGLAQAGVIVADDEGDAVQAALLERVEEGTPVDVDFGKRGADAEDSAGAAGVDADGDQDRAVDHGAIAAHLFVAGIEDEIRMGQGSPADGCARSRDAHRAARPRG